MSGEVLYRKWRPSRFADIMGQRAVVQTLSQAIATGRTAHAYLFCGPRGTGKTSTARVLAKALNCQDRPEGTGEPCGACAGCRAMDGGTFVDLIEIDAASNRGIDEIRSLREKVHFAPSQGLNKVYIIDEAHMLTEAAFNAFLKTLEEPPPRTIFILCTTEPHKLPATIISRCQRFDFHRISTGHVVERLGQIAGDEGVQASPAALELLARSAGGSLRDATNLLDQLITSYRDNLSVEAIREMLGAGGEEQALALVRHLLGQETRPALKLINDFALEGLDLRQLHRTTVECLRAALLLKHGLNEAVDLPAEVRQELSGLAAQVTAERIMRALRLFGQVSFKHDQPSPLPLELATMELSMAPEAAPAPAAPEGAPGPAMQRPAANGPSPRQSGARPAAVRPATPSNLPPARAPTPEATDRGDRAPAARGADGGPAAHPSASPDDRLASQWPLVVRSLSRQKGKRFNLGALLNTSKTRHLEGSVVVVRFAHKSNSERLQEEMDDPRCRMAIEQVLRETLGSDYVIRVETDENDARARSPQEQSHLVRAAISMGGQIVSSPSPLDPWEEQPHE